jgi:lipoprotein-releasing system permease protein
MNIISILPVEIFIAMRYLKICKTKKIIDLVICFISVFSISLSIIILIVSISITTGFQNDIKNKILDVEPHIVITRKDKKLFSSYKKLEDYIQKNKNVIDVCPFVYKQAVIKSVSKKYDSIMIKSIKYNNKKNIFNILNKNICYDKSFNNKLNNNYITIGNNLANNISVKSGDDVFLILHDEFDNIPEVYKLKIFSIFKSGIDDFDSYFVFSDLSFGQKLLHSGNMIYGFDVYVNDISKIIKLSDNLKKELSNKYEVSTWIDKNKNLFAALKLEKIMIIFVLGSIIFISGFTIISNLLLLSVQKIKEIGIMSAFGFSRISIAKIFFYIGIVISIIGIILGIIFGVSISFLLKYFITFKLPIDIYYSDKLPISIVSTDIFFISVGAFVISFVAVLCSVYFVSKLNPLDAIKHS